MERSGEPCGLLRVELSFLDIHHHVVLMHVGEPYLGYEAFPFALVKSVHRQLHLDLFRF